VKWEPATAQSLQHALDPLERKGWKLLGGCQLVMVSRWQEDCWERTALFTCLFLYRPYFKKRKLTWLCTTHLHSERTGTAWTTATCARPHSSCRGSLLSRVCLLLTTAGGQGSDPSTSLHSSAKLGQILEWGWDGKTNHERITEPQKSTLRGATCLPPARAARYTVPRDASLPGS